MPETKQDTESPDETIFAFTQEGTPVVVSREQEAILVDFFDTVEEAIKIGSEKLGLVHSKIIDGEFWMRWADGGYLVINPDPKVQTVVSGTDEMQKSKEKNIGIPQGTIVDFTSGLKKLIKRVK